jgi:hypothetical protein
MDYAIWSGNRDMCEQLLAQQCPCYDDICTTGARAGLREHKSLDLLHFFIKQGFAWDTEDLAQLAAEYNSVALMEFLRAKGSVFSAELLTELLNNAGANGSLQVAAWLRQQDAEWPIVLRHTSNQFGSIAQWSDDTLQWARAEGCTSPVE